MASVYDEVEIEDMDWKLEDKAFYYLCPCGDKFSITLEDLLNGEDIAKCPSCSLRIRVICDLDELEKTYAFAISAEEPPAKEVTA